VSYVTQLNNSQSRSVCFIGFLLIFFLLLIAKRQIEVGLNGWRSLSRSSTEESFVLFLRESSMLGLDTRYGNKQTDPVYKSMLSGTSENNARSSAQVTYWYF
jgi:hypothetical protein